MTPTKTALMIGLHPDVVDYGKWPGLTADKLRAGLDADLARLAEVGIAADVAFVDHGETAAEVAATKLAEKHWDVVLIGAGVRTDPDEFLLFETLINVVHSKAPQAAICFNTGPTDSLAAVQRHI
ncbi:MAG: hypothetical protein AAGF71_11895 [Pseudomonadota bacterium]